MLILAVTSLRDPGGGSDPERDAAVYATVIGDRGHIDLYLLARLCPGLDAPGEAASDAPVPVALHRALEGALGRDVTLVAHRPDLVGGIFYRLSPVEYSGERAVVSTEWWELRTLGCQGGSTHVLQLERGTWFEVERDAGSFFAGCP
jgi:hypothetical protein